MDPQIPPLGQISETDHAGVVSFLALLAQESYANRAQWAEIADQCVSIYTHGDSPQPDPDAITLHKIQNAVILDALTQMRTSQRPQLQGTDTGVKPLVYWTGPMAAATYLGLSPQETAAQVPIDPQLIEPLLAMMERNTPIPFPLRNGAQVPVGFNEDWLTSIDASTTTEVYQHAFDACWQRANTDLWMRQNLLDNNAQGWTWGLYEWNEEKQCPRLRHLSIHQVYVDPISRDIADATYAGLDFVLDMEEAKRLYPNLAEEIEEQGQIGAIRRPANAPYLGMALEGTDFKRKTVTLRIFWLRNQSIPMTPEEACGCGQVSMQQVPGTAGTPPMPAMPGEVMPEEPSGMMDIAGEATSSEATEQPPAPAGSPPAPTPTRPAFIHPEHGEVTPDHPAWPSRPGIRQITLLVDTVVDDRECEFWDIPLLHNVCIPLIGNKPYGIGEPHRLKNLQRGAGKILDNAVDYSTTVAHPGCLMAQGMHDATKNAAGESNINIRSIVLCPDDVFQKYNGEAFKWSKPPEWNPSHFQTYGEISKNLTEISGNQDVMQGSATSMSGVAIANQQGQATSMIEAKGQRTGDMAERYCNLVLWDICRRMSTEDVVKIVDKYPENVLRAILDNGQTMEWQWKIEMGAGSNAAKAQKRAEVREDYKLQLIDPRTAQESLDYDYRHIEQRREALQAQQMQAMQPAALMGGGVPQPPQQPGIPGGGQPGALA